jgi:integrase
MKPQIYIESITCRLRLGFSSKLFPDGRRRYLTLGLDDTKANRARANSLIKRVESDIELGDFDETLNRYAPSQKRQEKPTPVPVALTELWRKYVEYKTPTSAPTTLISTYQPITRLLAKLPRPALARALSVRESLLKVTTHDQTRRALMHLSAAHDWAIKNQLATENQYKGLCRDLPAPRYQRECLANPFTKDERDRIINEFGKRYPHFRALVAFWFLTGCRVSEGVGLRWVNVADDFSRVKFCEAIVTTNHGPVHRAVTKTGKTRTFTASPSLISLLSSHAPEDDSPDSLVFPHPSGRPLSYATFVRVQWATVLRNLGIAYRTPYCCRDTFITLQISQGVSSDIVAAWVGNSAEVIKKHYLDVQTLANQTPLE